MSETAQTSGWIIEDKIRPDELLQQGDLVNFAAKGSLQNLGLVVTADCDLQKRKHSRLITFVPVVDLKTVVERYLLIEQCDKQAESILVYACKRYDIPHDSKDPLVFEYLRAKALTGEAEESNGNLPLLAVRILLHEIDLIRSREYLDLMADMGVKVTLDTLKTKLNNQLLAKGDLIVLPSLDKLGFSANVAWVRRIWQAPVREIAFKNSDVKGDMGQRIARLDSPYRYRVTQVMGQVFADIGVPDVKNNFSTTLDEVII